MQILIIGYGVVGKHIYQEFKALDPDVYDPSVIEYQHKEHRRYDIAFVCVPTNSLVDGSCDTSIVEASIHDIDANIFVIKSTVPPGTTERLIKSSSKRIVFSPEHYGATQHCKSKSEFVILGGKKHLCEEVAKCYYKVKNGYYKMYFTDTVTAELSKYMLNSFLALKVTFCNEFASLAEKFDVSYPELRELFIADERVGASHTIAYQDKPFYDSHCFNKDIPALVSFATDKVPLIDYMHKLNLQKKQELYLF